MFLCYCSVAKLYLTLQPHGLQHPRLPCSSLSQRVCSDFCPLSQQSIHQSHPLSSPSPLALSLSQHQSFPMSQPFSSGGQSIGASTSASFLPNEYSGLISFKIDWFYFLVAQGTVKSTTVQKNQFFGAQPCLWFNFVCFSGEL